MRREHTIYLVELLELGLRVHVYSNGMLGMSGYYCTVYIPYSALILRIVKN